MIDHTGQRTFYKLKDGRKEEAAMKQAFSEMSHLQQTSVIVWRHGNLCHRK